MAKRFLVLIANYIINEQISVYKHCRCQTLEKNAFEKYLHSTYRML